LSFTLLLPLPIAQCLLIAQQVRSAKTCRSHTAGSQQHFAHSNSQVQAYLMHSSKLGRGFLLSLSARA
jgi:hypothetical protein